MAQELARWANAAAPRLTFHGLWHSAATRWVMASTCKLFRRGSVTPDPLLVLRLYTRIRCGELTVRRDPTPRLSGAPNTVASDSREQPAPLDTVPTRFPS